MTPAQHPHRDRLDSDIEATTPDHGEAWDEIYRDEQVWSGKPNTSLVAVMGEQLHLTPGSALDVCCGEGADAVWLAQQGWRVTATDVSKDAIARGIAGAQGAGVDVAWVVGDLRDEPIDAEFDLVSMFYPALLKTEDHGIERYLASLVAPGGVLLAVHHLDVDRERARAHGFDPDSYVSLDDLAGAFEGAGWAIERAELDRHVTEGRGAHHTRDGVLVARRPALAPTHG